MTVVDDGRGAPQACIHCAVRSRSLCGVLAQNELSTLNRISRRRGYDAGQTIILEGERALLGNVVSGTVVEKKSLSDGREQIVSLLFPADFVGAVQDGDADASALAVSDVTLCTFDRAGFENALDALPALKQALLDHAAHELADARQWMLLLGQMKATERVAMFLLRLASRKVMAGCNHYAFGVAQNGLEFEIPISRAQIAAYLGLTIETVSRKFGALREAGAIELHGSRTVRIVNAEILRAAAA